MTQVVGAGIAEAQSRRNRTKQGLSEPKGGEKYRLVMGQTPLRPDLDVGRGGRGELNHN